jgi:hypothetical protein
VLITRGVLVSFQSVARNMEMLFVRGDAVIMVRPLLLYLCISHIMTKISSCFAQISPIR